MSFSYHQRSYTVPMLLRSTTQSSHTCRGARGGRWPWSLPTPGHTARCSPRGKMGQLVLGASPRSGFLSYAQSSLRGDTNTELLDTSSTRTFTDRGGAVERNLWARKEAHFTSVSVHYFLRVLDLKYAEGILCLHLTTLGIMAIDKHKGRESGQT